MKFFVIFVIFLNFSEILGDAATSTFMGVSAADSIDRITSRKKKGWLSSIFSDDDFSLEQIMIVTEANMNNNGAMKAHLVIVYDKELMRELSAMTAYRYFDMVDQLIKDHPDKMKIYSWNLIAEDRIRPWQKIDTLRSTMSPLGGFIFAGYDNMGVHRAKVPNYEKVKVVFGRSDFTIDYEDKNMDAGEVTDITEGLGDEDDDDDGWF